MAIQINQYTKIRTSATVAPEDLMDFDSTDDAGSTYESAKIEVSQFLAYLGANGLNIYAQDSTILANRTLTAGGVWTKWLDGDIILQMGGEANDRAFLVYDGSTVEQARLGYNITGLSALLELRDIANGLWFKAESNLLQNQIYESFSGGGQLDLRQGADNVFALTNDKGSFTKAWYYGNDTSIWMGFGSLAELQMTSTYNTWTRTANFGALEEKLDMINDYVALGISDAGGTSPNNVQGILMPTLSAGLRTTINSDNFAMSLVSNNTTLNQNIYNSVAIGMLNGIVKTNYTAYVNQLGFNGGAAFETIVTHTTATADRTINLPDANMDFATAITEVLSFAGGGTGDVATMTFANGILTARTLVP